MTREERAKLKLQCLQLAIQEKTRDSQIDIIKRAEEFYKFITE